MPIRSSSEIVVRKALANVSLQYRNKLYVAEELFPLIDGLDKESKILEYKLAPWFRDEAGVRAEGSEAPRSNFSVTSQDFDPINYSAATTITDEVREQARIMGNLPIQPEIDAAEWIANKLDLKKEKRASAILHATNWSGVGAGGADAEGHWGDGTAANDTFLADLRTARDAILNATGYIANSLFLSWHAWSKLQIAPALLDLIYPQGWTPGQALVTSDALAVLAQVERVIIGRAVENTDEETVADTSSTMVQIWGTSGAETKGVGFLYYRPSAPAMKEASAGYQYRKKQDNGLGRKGTMWREDAKHQDVMDMQEDTQFLATGTSLGYMFKDTATT